MRRRARDNLARWLAFALAVAALPAWWARRMGSGMVRETAPDRVTAGHCASILLRMAERNVGAPAACPSHGPVLLLRGDRGPWRSVRPARLTTTREGIVCRFDFLVPADARALTYAFRFAFDGTGREVPGRKTIVVLPKSTRPDLAGPASMRAASR